MARIYCFVLFACFLFPVSIAFSYDVVLKNGKTVKGSLVSENDEVIVLQDASGIKMTSKKTLLDLQKDAREEMVPPGYLRTDDEYQEKLENETRPQ